MKCGSLKYEGAFEPRGVCSFKPRSDEEMAYSLGLTDHHLSLQTMHEVGDAIRKGNRPEFSAEDMGKLLNAIRDATLRPMMNSIRGIPNQSPKKKKGWLSFLQR
jgi:hypothetical protein